MVEPEPGSNTIAWLVWHLTRVQDDHLADAFGVEQVWTADGWALRFGLALPDADTGYGHDRAAMTAVRAGADLLLGYHEAVDARSLELLATLDAAALDRVVDTRWDPPVTLGRPAGQRAGRRPPARRSGRLPAGSARAPMTQAARGPRVSPWPFACSSSAVPV